MPNMETKWIKVRIAITVKKIHITYFNLRFQPGN